MSEIRLVFFGTPTFAATCLEGLLADEHYRIVGVVSQPDRPAGRNLVLTPSAVKKLALERGIPVLTPDKASRPEVIAELQGWNAECAVVVAYGQILSENLLRAFPRGAVNVHASLLPRWRGAAPIQRAIEAGDALTGVALQKMVKELDAGDVLGERRVAIDPEETALQLHDRLAGKAVELLHLELMDYLRGNLTGVPQNAADVTYAKKLLKTESPVDWRQSARAIHDKIRAFALGPGVTAVLQGKKIKLHRTRVGEQNGAPGEVLRAEGGSLVVGTGQGSLELIEVQPESRQRMKVTDFLQGHPLARGTRFD